MRTKQRCLSLVLALCTSVLFVRAAQAEVRAYPSCEHDPTESDISAAKGAYEAGQVSFHEADYDRALLYWEDAFRRDCTAVKLLLNIARAYELSGDLPSAVNALQTYLERRPDAKDRDPVEKRIANLQKRIDEESAAAAQPAAAGEPEDAEETSASESTTTDPLPAEESAENEKPVWPLWLTAGGLAVAAVGHLTILRGEELRQEKAEDLGCDLDGPSCPTNAATDQVNEAGKPQRDGGAALALVGHLAGITGGVFWWVLWSKDKDTGENAAVSQTTAIEPILAPGYQGLSVRGRF